MLSEREKLLFSNIVYRSLFGVFFTYEQIESVGFLDALAELFGKKLVTEYVYQKQRFIVLEKSENKLRDFLVMKNVVNKKKEILLKYLKFFRVVPFIRAVFISGSLAMGSVEENSDLDVFVLTKPGRIWTARFILSMLLSLFSIRRTKFESIAPNKICLSHYMTTNALFDYESIFTAQVLGNMQLLWEAERGTGFNFIKKHKWIKNYTLGFHDYLERPVSKIRRSSIQIIGEWILGGWFGSMKEWFLKLIQLRRIVNDKKFKHPNGRIVATNKMLEFHPDSQESAIIEQYNQTMKKLGFPELAKERSSRFETIF